MMLSAITFPNLGIDVDPSKIAFTIFGKDVYWYGILIATGFLLAVIYACRRAPKFGLKEDNVLDMLLYVSAGRDHWRQGLLLHLLLGAIPGRSHFVPLYLGGRHGHLWRCDRRRAGAIAVLQTQKGQGQRATGPGRFWDF